MTTENKTEFKVESGIPVAKTAGRGRPGKYPWRDMKVGDSFFIPDILARAFSPTAYNAGKRHGRKYACRTVEGGVRVWRVE